MCVADLPVVDRKIVWNHGDFGAFNMFWDGNRITPIDFAGAIPGLPFADVNLFHSSIRNVALRASRSAVSNSKMAKGIPVRVV